MDYLIFWVLYFGLQGAVVGSFLNVLVDRLPRNSSLMGRSSCDYCKRKLGILELVPVFSYILLGGKTKCCKKKLSARYPMIEGLVAIFFAIGTYYYAATHIVQGYAFWVGLISFLTIISVSLAITLIDIDHHIIPDSLQIVFFLVVCIFLSISNDLSSIRLAQASLVSLPILLLYLGTKGNGMGYGDIKLAFTLGLWVGLWKGLLGLYLGFIIGASYGAILIIRKIAGRKSEIAFGPFLLLGAWISFLFADKILKLMGF